MDAETMVQAQDGQDGDSGCDDPVKLLLGVSGRLDGLNNMTLEKALETQNGNGQEAGYTNLVIRQEEGMLIIIPYQMQEGAVEQHAIGESTITYIDLAENAVSVMSDSRKDPEVEEATKTLLEYHNGEDQGELIRWEALTETLTSLTPQQQDDLAKVAPTPTVSKSDRRFTCHCGKSFLQLCHLTVHQRLHTGEKPFACSVCDKRFSQQSGLQVHERVHTGEKPFMCSQCGATFAQVANLRAHQKRHTRVMPFACDGCDMRFFNQNNLRVHQRTHTGEKPFQCQICDKRFTQNGNLKSHMRRHEHAKIKKEEKEAVEAK